MELKNYTTFQNCLIRELWIRLHVCSCYSLFLFYFFFQSAVLWSAAKLYNNCLLMEQYRDKQNISLSKCRNSFIEIPSKPFIIMDTISFEYISLTVIITTHSLFFVWLFQLTWHLSRLGFYTWSAAASFYGCWCKHRPCKTLHTSGKIV